MRLLITGAGGYIGRALVAEALSQGHRVVALGTRAPNGVECIPWRLGEPVPNCAWTEPVDVVAHLAHAWHTVGGAEEDDINIRGATVLLAAARNAGVGRVVFVSSLSARADALNRYGRIKSRIESMLQEPDEISVRVGLVYGGAGRSLWGTLRKLCALPVLPVVAATQPVQLIHIADVARGLLAIAAAPALPARMVLAAEPPVLFGAFLKTIARQVHGRSIVLLDVPQRTSLAALNAAIAVRLPLVSVRERVRGLVGIRVQPVAADLALIGLAPMGLDEGLGPEAPQRAKRRVAEAAALLRYALGVKPGPATLRRFLRAVRRLHFDAPVVPGWLRHCPPLLRFVEPLPGDRRARAIALRARLAIALVLADTEKASAAKLYAYTPSGRMLAWGRLIVHGTVEALVLVPRMIAARLIWR